VQLWGLLDKNIPLPIAAVARVQMTTTPHEPIVSFPIILGEDNELDPWGWFILQDRDGRIEWMSMSFASSDLLKIATPAEDGSYRGVGALAPSRALALSTRRFDRYLGEEVSLPVEIEVRTVPGRWMGEEEVYRERQTGRSRITVTREP